MNFFQILYAEIERKIVLMKRYPYQYFLNLVIIMILLFSSVSPLLKDTKDFSIVDAFIGFMMWNVTLSVMQQMGWQIQSESQLGTLENVIIASGNIAKVLVARSLESLLESIVVILCEALVISWLFSVPLTDWGTLLSVNIIVIFLISAAGMYGFGMILAGIGLILKRIGAIAEVLNYVFLLFTGAFFPIENSPHFLQLIGKSIPLTLGIDLMRKINNQDMPVFSSKYINEFAMLLIQSVFYMLVGFIIFELMLYIAKKKGILGLH